MAGVQTDLKPSKTVRIRITSSLATSRRGYKPGEEVDWEAEDAKRLIERGFAVPVKAAKRTATEAAPETR